MNNGEKLGEENIQTNDAWILKDGRTGVGWQLDIIGRKFIYNMTEGCWVERIVSGEGKTN
jgi:hypothetical protein